MKGWAVYKLAEGFGNIPRWPYGVDYVPQNAGAPFLLWEGDAKVGSGGFVPTVQVVGPEWREHLAHAGALWLLPLLERMAAGEPVAEHEVLDAYRAVHGRAPESTRMP